LPLSYKWSSPYYSFQKWNGTVFPFCLTSKSVPQSEMITYRNVSPCKQISATKIRFTLKLQKSVKRCPKLLIKLGTDFEFGQKRKIIPFRFTFGIIWRWSPRVVSKFSWCQKRRTCLVSLQTPSSP
jgi:hypothetical protein